MAAPLGELAVDAVFVLSVKTFTERIAHVRRELEGFRIPFEFIFDFDAAEQWTVGGLVPGANYSGEATDVGAPRRRVL